MPKICEVITSVLTADIYRAPFRFPNQVFLVLCGAVFWPLLLAIGEVWTFLWVPCALCLVVCVLFPARTLDLL